VALIHVGKATVQFGLIRRVVNLIEMGNEGSNFKAILHAHLCNLVFNLSQTRAINFTPTGGLQKKSKTA